MRSSAFKDILDARLKEAGFVSEMIDLDQPLAPQLAETEVLVNGRRNPVDKSIIDMCPKLQLLHQAGIGYDKIDVAYCTAKSIFVANISVAEHTIFLMMYLAKDLHSADGSGLLVKRVSDTLGNELDGKTLLVVGLGATGTEVAKRATVFGMHVIGITKDPVAYKPGREKSFFVEGINDPSALSETIPKADFISLHVPLNDETLGMISAKEFDMMKRSAFLVNVARAPVVDRDALFDALQKKRIAGAAFDVFWEEPADPKDKLLKLDNFILTPHMAGWTVESVNAMAGMIAANILRVSDGNSPLTLVNPELLRQ
jgi:D-3-phosphoglycerate dehydrogenase / 2-oxoglutarate reductase